MCFCFVFCFFVFAKEVWERVLPTAIEHTSVCGDVSCNGSNRWLFATQTMPYMTTDSSVDSQHTSFSSKKKRFLWKKTFILI